MSIIVLNKCVKVFYLFNKFIIYPEVLKKKILRSKIYREANFGYFKEFLS